MCLVAVKFLEMIFILFLLLFGEKCHQPLRWSELRNEGECFWNYGHFIILFLCIHRWVRNCSILPDHRYQLTEIHWNFVLPNQRFSEREMTRKFISIFRQMLKLWQIFWWSGSSIWKRTTSKLNLSQVELNAKTLLRNETGPIRIHSFGHFFWGFWDNFIEFRSLNKYNLPQLIFDISQVGKCLLNYYFQITAKLFEAATAQTRCFNLISIGIFIDEKCPCSDEANNFTCFTSRMFNWVERNRTHRKGNGKLQSIN